MFVVFITGSTHYIMLVDKCINDGKVFKDNIVYECWISVQTMYGLLINDG